MDFWLILLLSECILSPSLPLLQVHKFLDKNHDQVRQDVLDLFVRSRTRVSEPRRPGPPSTQPTVRPLPQLGPASGSPQPIPP